MRFGRKFGHFDRSENGTLEFEAIFSVWSRAGDLPPGIGRLNTVLLQYSIMVGTLAGSVVLQSHTVVLQSIQGYSSPYSGTTIRTVLLQSRTMVSTIAGTLVLQSRTLLLQSRTLLLRSRTVVLQPRTVVLQPVQWYSSPAQWYSSPAQWYSSPVQWYSNPVQWYPSPVHRCSNPVPLCDCVDALSELLLLLWRARAGEAIITELQRPNQRQIAHSPISKQPCYQVDRSLGYSGGQVAASVTRPVSVCSQSRSQDGTGRLAPFPARGVSAKGRRRDAGGHLSQRPGSETDRRPVKWEGRRRRRERQLVPKHAADECAGSCTECAPSGRRAG